MDAKGIKGRKGLKRIVIYSNDIQLITGKKEKGARNLLKRIKISFNKSDESFVTIDEFCIYTGLEKDDIIHLINDF